MSGYSMDGYAAALFDAVEAAISSLRNQTLMDRWPEQLQYRYEQGVQEGREQAIRDCIAAVNADGWGNSIPLGMSEAMFASAVKDKFLYALKDLLAREQSIPRALLEGDKP